VGIYHKAMRFKFEIPEGISPWKISTDYKIGVPLAKDTDVAFKFWARSPESLKLAVYVEQRRAPYTKSVGRSLTMSADWKEYELRGKVKSDYAPDEAEINLHLGHGSGSIEITGVRLYVGKLPPIGADKLTAIPEELLQTGLPPLEGANIVSNGDFAQNLAEWEGLTGNDRTKTTVSSIKDPRFSNYLTVEGTPRTDDKPWSIAPRQVLNAPIKKGETIVVRAWLRSPQAGKVAVILEQNKAPFAKTIDNLLRLSTDWKQYEVRGTAAQDFPAGSARFSLYLAYDPITVDIANLQVVKVP
jgi:Carbohydrate binding domain